MSPNPRELYYVTVLLTGRKENESLDTFTRRVFEATISRNPTAIFTKGSSLKYYPNSTIEKDDSLTIWGEALRIHPIIRKQEF